MNSIIRNRAYRSIITLLIIAGLLASCNLQDTLSGIDSKNPVEPPIQPDSGLPLAEVTFEMTALSNAPSGIVTLEILDEITGLAFNPKRYEMDALGGNRYKTVIPIAIGSVVKYRFISPGSPTAIEYSASGKQVRYRMFKVDGPASVSDTVAGWTNQLYDGPTGRINGQIIDRETNTPIPSALVTAGGAQTLTASDGSFLLEGLTPGTHNMVVYALDGKFPAFQQGATVAENATTPAAIYVDLAELVKVTFVVQVPAAEIKGFPLRLVGSTYSLGNTFSDLDGGMSSVASHAPVLSMIADDIYSVTLELPVGLDLKYKYSLGDGFWNAEHNKDGTFRIRQLIVPENEITVTDIIDGWKAGSNAPISFTVTVPQDTPSTDTISIQFNPYGWTSPIPMWPLGNGQWLYVLYSPLDMFGEIQYRYCRNDLCGIADDQATHAYDVPGRKITTSSEAQTITDEITAWIYWEGKKESTTIIAPEISSRRSDFIAGVEFTHKYSPFWQSYVNLGLKNVSGYGSNWVILSPSWSYTRVSPVVIEPVIGRDPLWVDTIAAVQMAESATLNAALFPRLRADLLPNGVWAEEITDSGWWDGWFDRYHKFAIHYADLASQTQASMLILGGPEITPALPEGTLDNGEPSGVPETAAEEWQSILAGVRDRFNGKIAWAVTYPFTATPLPEWIDSVDVIYVLFSAPLTESISPNQGELQNAFTQMLITDIQPLAEETGKPVIIAIDYPAADGAATACIQLSEQCMQFEFLNQPSAVLDILSPDLQEQLDIYNAALNALAPLDWVGGFISRGYFYPAALQDASSSVHGKPAADVLWYWFPKLLDQ